MISLITRVCKINICERRSRLIRKIPSGHVRQKNIANHDNDRDKWTITSTWINNRARLKWVNASWSMYRGFILTKRASKTKAIFACDINRWKLKARTIESKYAKGTFTCKTSNSASCERLFASKISRHFSTLLLFLDGINCVKCVLYFFTEDLANWAHVCFSTDRLEYFLPVRR